jgi:hypothetical protein
LLTVPPWLTAGDRIGQAARAAQVVGDQRHRGAQFLVEPRGQHGFAVGADQAEDEGEHRGHDQQAEHDGDHHLDQGEATRVARRRKRAAGQHVGYPRMLPVLLQTLAWPSGDTLTVSTKRPVCEVRSKLLASALPVNASLRAPRRPSNTSSDAAELSVTPGCCVLPMVISRPSTVHVLGDCEQSHATGATAWSPAVGLAAWIAPRHHVAPVPVVDKGHIAIHLDRDLACLRDLVDDRIAAPRRPRLVEIGDEAGHRERGEDDEDGDGDDQLQERETVLRRCGLALHASHGPKPSP